MKNKNFIDKDFDKKSIDEIILLAKNKKAHRNFQIFAK